MEPNTTLSRVEIEFTLLETSVAAAVLTLILTLTIVGNCTVCYVIYRNKRMWTIMNMFLVNLAFGDLAVGFLSMVFPLVTAIRRKWIFNDIICQINAVCNSVLFCSTLFTHLVISIDRYFAIVRPMKKFMTAKKALLMILSVWIVSVVLVMGPVFGWGHMEFNPTTLQCGYGFPRTKYESLYILLLALIAFVIPLIAMTVLYCRVLHSLRGHTRRMSMTASGAQRQAALKAQIKIGATFFLAFVAFFICWAPFCAFIAYAVAVKERTNIPHGLGLAAYWCGFVNSLCNPFIVGIRNEQFKRAFAKIFCCCCRSGRRTRSYRGTRNGLYRSKTSTRSRSTTDSDTKVTETTVAKSNSTRSSYAVDARQIREELDRDASERDALPEYDPGNIVFEPSPKRKRKSGTHVSPPLETNIPYKQFVHFVGKSSFRESGV